MWNVIKIHAHGGSDRSKITVPSEYYNKHTLRSKLLQVQPSYPFLLPSSNARISVFRSEGWVPVKSQEHLTVKYRLDIFNMSQSEGRNASQDVLGGLNFYRQWLPFNIGRLTACSVNIIIQKIKLTCLSLVTKNESISSVYSMHASRFGWFFNSKINYYFPENIYFFYCLPDFISSYSSSHR